MDLLKDLNPKQQEVVQVVDGPLLVLAGAGSGKTKALTHRIAYLISNAGINPQNILAITFTNKAAKEMGDRVKKLLESETKLPTMGTFHSVCARTLRSEGHFLGFTSGFTIFDEDDSLKLIKFCIKKLDLSDDRLSPKTVKNQISNAKNELIGPEQFAGFASGYNAPAIMATYAEYQKQLQKNDAMDFDDLIFNVVRIFREQKQVLEKYQRIWKYLLIDEYQDTNQAQYIFAKLLAAVNQNICVVGDDWQSIYSWRGANFQNILNFQRDWPSAKIIKLEQNYRSTKSILTAAQHVIEKNYQRSEKVLWTENPGGSLLNVYEAKSESDEGGFVCREILSLSSNGYRLRDMAIFYRTNAQSRAIEEQLLRYRIPYKIVGGVRFYERKEIKDVLSWLRMATGNGDFISFERSLGTPPSGIGAKTLSALREYAEKENLSARSLLLSISNFDFVSPRMRNILSEYYLKVEKIRKAAQTSVKDAIETAIKNSGIREYLDDGTFQNEERLENLKELLSVADEYSRLKNGLTLDDFLEEVALISDLDNYQEETEGITLMTVHTSKGLEYKNVFLVGLEENIFPHSRSQLDPTELEEERRLFYVALTRARENIYLIYSVSRLFFGSIQANPPSRFLAEIPEPLKNLMNTSGSGNIVQIEDDRMPGAFMVGDKVEHEHFGVGDVKAVCEDEITVKFPGMEEKVISVYYAPIKKV